MSAEAPLQKRQKTTATTPTVKEIEEDALTALARENWSDVDAVEFSDALVKQLYASELKGTVGELPRPHRVAMLELSQYLEKYLWPNFDPEAASLEHLLSIIALINQKLNERTHPWTHLHAQPEKFGAFFGRVLDLDVTALVAAERTSYVLFLVHCFQSLENETNRNHVLKLVSLPLWHNLSSDRRQLELRNQPALMKRWNRLLKKESKTATEGPRHDVTFLPNLIQLFLIQLHSFTPADPETASDPLDVTFCERFLEFLTDLLSQLPTRRFIKAVLMEQGIWIKCQQSSLYSLPEGNLFRQLVQIFGQYLDFNIDEHSGEPYSEDEIQSRHYEKLTQLQRLLFKYWSPQLQDYAMMDCANLQKRSTLEALLNGLSEEAVQKLVVTQLKLVSPQDLPWSHHSEFLKEMFLSHYERRSLQREQINAMPLYPTEALLWDATKIPDGSYRGESCLPVPKLNLQFLSLHDYLMRNFEIYRLEAAYEIQDDVTDVLSRVGASVGEDGKVFFKGWARMATPITHFKIIEVQKPLIGFTKPASVKAEITFSTKFMRKDVRSEWDGLREHDVTFLIGLDPNTASDSASVKDQYGVTCVRGCEILEVKDEEGKLMNDFSSRVSYYEPREPTGHTRTLIVSLDAAQYQLDTAQGVESTVYGEFSLLMRRRAKENNFKSVLECVRDVMNEGTLELEWLQDVFLGYGHPSAAHYTHLTSDHLLELDLKDTFLDVTHVQQSFPDYEVEIVEGSKEPPFKLCFSVLPGVESTAEKRIQVESYQLPNLGPFPQDQPLKNTVRFTPVQIGAIVAGLQKGLSMVVGPPGTGKTDTAVQILHMLYHNFPNQKTLLMTHSNHALNDLFQKLMERDVPSRYLLRLGMGEQELETESDFSRAGRVHAMLARRLELLEEVSALTKELQVNEDMAYSCETAGHFWMLHVLPRWEKYLTQIHTTGTSECIQELFPFKQYFSKAPAEAMFKGASFEEDLETAQGCFRHLRAIFGELEECRAFELLKSQTERVNYLLTKQAKIVAMTCTHAALKRKEFLKIRFQYDNVLMEESGQVLEIETFLPWTLQAAQDGQSRLKRVILIGDHHQLPPIVKHPAFQKYSQMDQSLFQRFVRLGMPFLQLDAQGRCRPSLAQLFNWRYSTLGDLPCVQDGPEYQLANPGFAYDYQFVDVLDPVGVGESVPTPFFYQNLAEAEYLVRVYKYMRLLGYPSEKISVLTTYNGQKHLLRDVFERHCTGHPAFGRPHKVTTVDKYQGQQNDYILLSLVRTRAIGHIRDVRRLVVATSRAKLGLYIFGCAAIFQNCYEMQPVFQQWLRRPLQLSLVKGEAYHHCSRPLDARVDVTAIAGLTEMDALVQQMTQEWESHQHKSQSPESVL